MLRAASIQQVKPIAKFRTMRVTKQFRLSLSKMRLQLNVLTRKPKPHTTYAFNAISGVVVIDR